MNTDNPQKVSTENIRNLDYIQSFCNDRRNPFHFACRHWYLYDNPQ